MDPEAAIPDSQQHTASTSECTSARPKPFDDSDISARKRRRTSLSGSPPRSIDSAIQPQDSAIPAAILEGDDDTINGVTNMDVGTTPKTPESSSSPSDPITNPPSSKVTINLRKNTDAGVSEAMSRPLSPCPEREQEADSVEFLEATLARSLEEAIHKQSGSFSSTSRSPPIELVQIPEDEDAELEAAVEEVSPVGHHLYALDPTDQFPYNDPQEHLYETVNRLSQYISSQTSLEETILIHTQRWLDMYLAYTKNADWRRVLQSCRLNRIFWLAIPDVVFSMANKKPPLHKTPGFHDIAMEFYCGFMDLTAYFVTLDIHVIRETPLQLPPTGVRAPDLLSASYLRQVGMLTRRDSLLKYEPPSATADGLIPLFDDVTYLVNTLQNGLGGGLGVLEEFVARLVDMLPTFPRLIDSLGHVCEVLLSLSQEALRVIRLGQDNEQQAKASLLENAHALFANVSACVELLIGKHVTQLNADGLQNSILALAELLKVCVQGSHKLAAEASWEYQQQHPELPLRYAAEAISLEWRFDILGTLIRCSQMQLRVMAVTTMCNELVAVWKQYNDDFTNPLLKHVSDYLVRTDLIEYIIGPNCHPEIILESANVIGFLAVTKMYQPQHTDRIWHAIITSQDPRVSDALTRMVTTIVGLFSYSSLSDLCGKLQDLPLEDFSPAIRALWESLMHHMPLRAQAERRMLTYQPYELCLRLLRESSICANGSQVANPELQQLSMQKFKELLHHGPDEQGRADLYRSCLQDVSDKSRTALGSLWCLSMTIRSTLAHEMEILTKEHDMTRLIVEELEHAAETGKFAGVPAVLCDNTNQPRRDFISHIIQFQPATLHDVLGEKLWDILVGSRSPCPEDRAAGWSILNTIVRRSPVQNPFIRECVSRYLPSLPSQCFCEGMLEFVKTEVLALVSNTEDFHIDDEQSVSSSCLEQLWRIIHTAEDAFLVDQAIRILVVDVYMDSELLSSYPLNRRRQVHSSLVTRCFSRLKEAAKQIKASAEGTSSSEDDSMVIVATEKQIQEQELSFIRTLQLLRYFLEAYQSKPNLAAPDLRAFMGQPPTQIEGELAQLKYQSFDGSEQTDVKPLNIGRLNSGASLLACLREETGFHNYRMYYRGQQFLPDERQVCKSLDDLHFSEGLILVKKEEDDANNTVRIKPGSSPLQIKILAHFKEMWEFLSMEEKLAREIYNFLIQLPADIHIMETFEDPEASHRDIFPVGQPFKCLYAIHALFEYKGLVKYTDQSSRRLLSMPEFPRCSYEQARIQSMSLIVNALSDDTVLNQTSERLTMQLTANLIHIFQQWIRDINPSETQFFEVANVGISSPDVLVSILHKAASSYEDSAFHLTLNSLSAILRLGLLDLQFWEQTLSREAFISVVKSLILFDPRSKVREIAVQIIEEHVSLDDQLSVAAKNEESSTYSLHPHRLARFFWSVILDILPEASFTSENCHEFFALSQFLLCSVFNRWTNLVDFHTTAERSSQLLLDHASLEDIDQAEPRDAVAHGLASILLSCLQQDATVSNSQSLPDHLSHDLFWKHLFPTTRHKTEQPVPRVILNTTTRAKLGDVIFQLVKENRSRFALMLKCINDLIPYYTSDEEDPYLYDITSGFDRFKAIRNPCGYVGLRNLSNTCYLNSLLTQLYMNTNFRRFLMAPHVEGPPGSQQLLLLTQKLFGFMQESYRRFVDPVDVVTSIRTYDDTLIDIHSQMDVDEFYNLLFDRWEGQLVTAQERKELRSFYGGQLVQQVKSQECEHISERLEPFSAIQCDIKGKSSLQDSLQAYVDGELLGGDNKYKCSTCDRHVDAVKRACLKDLPDNIIFHLKRFDFNLRTLQRSKINDYFSFPTTIDLKPYTVDHLRDPADNEPDIFELVGILVHAGTAESGHYYSYIRERPSAAGQPTWIEFNDDSVSQWDPAFMEASTFGGPDNRPPFDTNGIIYDKSYSAYMLFYQRSSSLRAQQEDILQGGSTIPLRVDMDTLQREHILDENTTLLRRHCLFDPSHAVLVQNCFEHAKEYCMVDNIDVISTASQQDIILDADSRQHGLRDLAMEMTLGHFDQIVTRKKELPEFDSFNRMIEAAIQSCHSCAFAFYDYFYQRPAAFRFLALRNPESVVRLTAGQNLLAAAKKIASDTPVAYTSTSPVEDDARNEDMARRQSLSDRSSLAPRLPVIEGIIHILRHLWRFFQFHIRAWDEYFSLILGFAQLGHREVAYLLADDYFAKLSRIITADPMMDLPANYARMLQTILRRINNRPPSYVAVIHTIEYLSVHLSPVLGVEYIVETPEERLEQDEGPFPWTADEVTCVHSYPERNRQISFFVEKLLAIDQAQQSSDNIVIRLIQTSEQMDMAVVQALRKNIRGDLSPQPLEPFLRVAARYLEITEFPQRSEKLALHIGTQAKTMSLNESALILNFFKASLLIDRQGYSTSRLHDYCIELIPEWAPAVLAHPSRDVGDQLAQILDQELFCFAPEYDMPEEDETLSKKMSIVLIVQRLGIACLVYLRDVYVKRRMQISRGQAECIAKVARKCTSSFDVHTNRSEEFRTEFLALREEVMEPLQRLVVDEIEDDGSEWDGSCASSEPMDDIAEMSVQAINELDDSNL